VERIGGDTKNYSMKVGLELRPQTSRSKGVRPYLKEAKGERVPLERRSKKVALSNT